MYLSPLLGDGWMLTGTGFSRDYLSGKHVPLAPPERNGAHPKTTINITASFVSPNGPSSFPPGFLHSPLPLAPVRYPLLVLIICLKFGVGSDTSLFGETNTPDFTLFSQTGTGNT